MTDTTAPDRLDDVLASVGRHLAYPDPGGLGVGALASPRRLRRHAWALAAGIVVALGAGAALPPVRTAVADLLGLGSTRVEYVPPEEGAPAGLPSVFDTLQPASRAAARAAIGRELPSSIEDVLGPSDLVATPPEGGAVLAWRQPLSTLWVRPGAGAAALGKLITPDDGVEPVAGVGEAAVLVTGDHVLVTPQRRLAAGSVLIWVDDGLEYRYESRRDPGEMLEVARAISPSSDG